MTPICVECEDAEVPSEGDTCAACAECATEGCDDMRTGPGLGQRFCERCTEELVAITLDEMTPAQMRAAGFVDEEGWPDNVAIIEEVWS